MQSHEKKVFWFFTFCFFITCWQSGKKKLRISPKRQLFSYLCHILLRTKLLILQTPMGTTTILSTYLENAKLFLTWNPKEILCFLSFIFWVTANYFLGDKNWIMVVKSLSKTIFLSWKQIGNTFSQNTFYSSKTGVEEVGRGLQCKWNSLMFSEVLVRELSK